jgi:hypothetical protein
MSASTFVNTIQLDYDTFKRETLEAIEHVRRHAPPPGAGAPSAAPPARRAHA